MQEFKYKDEIDELECDLSDFEERNRDGYRWTFQDINDVRNFSPRYLIEPTIERNSCLGWGLSFFDTKESAKARLNELTKVKKFLFKKLGTHIAEGNLNENDGISNPAGDNGHFTLIEYNGVDLTVKFSIIEKVA